MPVTPLRAGALLAAAAVLGAGGGAATYAVLAPSGTTVTTVREVAKPSGSSSSAQPAAATNALSINEIYRRASKSVVEITVTTTSNQGPFGGQQTQRAQGSGFVYDGQGHVVTNEHVVSGATTVSVQLQNGHTYSGTVVGTDPSTDLAVIKVDAPSGALTPLQLGDSGSLQVGDGVVAIGSPFGLEDSVTSGIVSALNRQISSPNGFSINDAIQTDAAINHGNSGGPLFNLQGQVVGVTAQIESDSGGNDGVGFAIPSNTVRTIASQLIASGKVEHAYLGVAVETIPADVAKQLGTAAGAEVAQVRSGTPAAKAGLRAATGQQVIGGQPYPTGGDVITAVDGKAIATSEELQNAINAKKPGETVAITYVRGGAQRTVDVTLGTRPS